MDLIKQSEINEIDRLNQNIDALRIQRDKIINNYIGDNKQFLTFNDFDHYYYTKLVK